MKCIICDSNNVRIKYRLKERNVYKCSICGLEILVNDQPFSYNTDYYEKNYFSEGFQDEEFYVETTRGLQLSSNDALLDVGCGKGDYLSHLAKNHLFVKRYANDLCNILAENSIVERQKFFEGDFNSISINEYFKAITMWDLFEHVDNPIALFSKAKGLLEEKGKVFIYTVNSDCLLRKIGDIFYKLGLKKFIEKLYPPYHLFYFNKNNLQRICDNLNMDVNIWGYKYYETDRMEVAIFYKLFIRLIYLLESLFSEKKTNIYFIAIKK